MSDDWKRAAEDLLLLVKAGPELLARVLRLEQERDELKAEAERLQDELTDYKRPSKWAEGSQMRHVQDLTNIVKRYKRRYELAEAHADRLKMALAWYADESRYADLEPDTGEYRCGEADIDAGERARAALAAEEGSK